VTYRVGDLSVRVRYRVRRDGRTQLWVGDGDDPVTASVTDDGAVEVDGHRAPVRVTRRGDRVQLHTPAGRVDLAEEPRFPEPVSELAAGATLSPMPGAVVTVAVAVGDEVATGALLCTVEAMKMEHRVTAPLAGTVTEVHVSPGQQVDADELLVVVASADERASDDGAA
jgi:propionyl-CoA carboxylase alpha chain